MDYWDVDLSEVLLPSNPRQEEDLRGIHSATAHYDLFRGVDDAFLSGSQHFDPIGLFCCRVDQHSGCCGVEEDVEVPAVFERS